MNSQHTANMCETPMLLMNSDIQHTQLILGVAISIAMLGTMFLTLLSRWIGSPWPTLIAILATCLLAYQPLIGASLFAGFKTDLLRRILFAAMPFTLLLILLSFKRVPKFARILLALIGPALMLVWIFIHFDLEVPRQTLFLHKIFPIAAAIFISWSLIEPLGHGSPGAASPIVATAITAGIAFLLMISAENQAGAVAPLIPATAGGALLACIIGSLIRKPVSTARGPLLVWFTLIGCLVAFLWIDTDQLPTKYLLWIAAAIPLAWIPEIGPLHRMKPWRRETLRFALVWMPVIVAITLAFKQHKREAAESGDEYGMIQPAPTGQVAAPKCPSQMPIPKTINPPTIT